MIEFTPNKITIILGVTLTITTSQYFYFKDSVFDENERVNSDASLNYNVSNYWGKPNAEFDWCERNYYLSEFISEFVNTLTGFLYIFVSFVAYTLMSDNIIISLHVKLNLLFISMIGVGTVLFHCTLQYTHQLIDELPIYYLVSNGALILYFRNTGGGEPRNDLLQNISRIIIVTLCIVLTFILLTTTRENSIHNIGRGIMSTVFSILFLYVFVAISKSLNEIKNSKLNTQMKMLFQKSFLEFLLAILCWVVDNSCCIFLQTKLPFYPQLHASWHLFTCTGLYKLILILAYIEKKPNERIKLNLKYRVLQMLPMLLEGKKKNE
jgi:dihydroceramidase